MKVRIKKYPDRLICDIHTNYMDKKYDALKKLRPDYKQKGLLPVQEPFKEMILEKIENAVQSVYDVINRLWLDKRVQKVKVRIDPWDTWSMDNTLALIILPMLKQLKETKHSYPHELSEEEWDNILDEMIWAFEQKCKDCWISEYDYKWDNEDAIAHQGRMTDGFKLFGRFYENLWD